VKRAGVVAILLAAAVVLAILATELPAILKVRRDIRALGDDSVVDRLLGAAPRHLRLFRSEVLDLLEVYLQASATRGYIPRPAEPVARRASRLLARLGLEDIARVERHAARYPRLAGVACRASLLFGRTDLFGAVRSDLRRTDGAPDDAWASFEYLSPQFGEVPDLIFVSDGLCPVLGSILPLGPGALDDVKPVSLESPGWISAAGAAAPAIPGNCYLVRTNNVELDLTVALRVLELVPEKSVKIEWRILEVRRVSRDEP
jgi:hypothetical protein